MAGRIDGRTDWGEGKDPKGRRVREGGLAGRFPLPSFSPPLPATLNYMFSGEMARTRRPQPTIHPTTALSRRPTLAVCRAVVYPSFAAPEQCSREKRERPNHAERKTTAAEAATATVYTLLCYRELTYAMEPTPARARLVDCLLPADRSIGGRTRRCGTGGGGKERTLAKLAGARERRKRCRGCCFGRSVPSPPPLLSCLSATDGALFRERRKRRDGRCPLRRPRRVADSTEQKASQVKRLLSVLPFPLQQNWICSLAPGRRPPTPKFS